MSGLCLPLTLSRTTNAGCRPEKKTVFFGDSPDAKSSVRYSENNGGGHWFPVSRMGPQDAWKCLKVAEKTMVYGRYNELVSSLGLY